jgi:hypothetical protein
MLPLNVELEISDSAICGACARQLHIFENFTLVTKCSAEHFVTK